MIADLPADRVVNIVGKKEDCRERYLNALCDKVPIRIDTDRIDAAVARIRKRKKNNGG